MADYRVPESLAETRLDQAVAEVAQISRSRAVELINSGAVLVNGRAAVKSHRVVPGATLTVAAVADPPASSIAVGPEPTVELPVLYRDDAVVIIDKPAGVAAHSSPGWTGPTVVGCLRAQGVDTASSGPAEREGIVHRLDVGTSGLMVVAVTEQAYQHLKDAFRDRTVTKTYHALVQGLPDPTTGTIDAPIGRDSRHDHRFAVTANGKPAVTHYDLLEAFAYGSLLTIGLETGRTHQIRVHMSAFRHPCLGDTTYGADPKLAARLELTRQWLHAVELGFVHPVTGREVEFVSEYPADLSLALTKLRELSQ